MEPIDTPFKPFNTFLSIIVQKDLYSFEHKILCRLKNEMNVVSQVHKK
jgi:hypothetical protein